MSKSARDLMEVTHKQAAAAVALAAAGKTYIVANPRGLPAGKWIVRDGAKRYFEGDTYEGTPPARFIAEGFVREVPVG